MTHKAGAVLAERWLHVRGLCKRVDEAHLAVKQRASFHEVVDHLLPADLPVSGEERERGELRFVGGGRGQSVGTPALTGSCPALRTC